VKIRRQKGYTQLWIFFLQPEKFKGGPENPASNKAYY